MNARPGCSSESRQPGLQKASHENKGVLTSRDEKDQGKRDESVHGEAGQHGHHVESEHTSRFRQRMDLQNLARYQAHDTDWRIPVYREYFSEKSYR